MTNSTSAGPNSDDTRFYGYIPSLAATVIFTVLFFFSTIIHLGQSIRYKMWFLLLTAVAAGNFEVTGWAARTYSHFHPDKLMPYLIQTVSTINAPTPLVAAYFIILAEIIRRLGPCYSRLRPKMYSIVFLTADIVALTVQGVGGAIAATAAGNNKDPTMGGRIMLGGIVFQMIAITGYMILAIEFIFRYLNDKPFQRPDNEPPTGNYYLDKKMKTMLLGTSFSSLAIYVRSVYRTIELTDGWNGRIITTEIYFNTMDGAMIVLAMYCLNVFHPGRLLGPFTSIEKAESVIDDDLLKKKGYA
ncbi:RTA1-domain-containing protein [Thelephora terrestris]|uniref:RTA1-domain-containing protein n=1 Tax=Thelephora terrestris TaxID=56493 RepID=A0A9P6HLV3_9AGAM|nr:RTA1-domain-containing protein [Thelephora terrestris]